MKDFAENVHSSMDSTEMMTSSAEKSVAMECFYDLTPSAMTVIKYPAMAARKAAPLRQATTVVARERHAEK